MRTCKVRRIEGYAVRHRRQVDIAKGGEEYQPVRLPSHQNGLQGPRRERPFSDKRIQVLPQVYMGNQGPADGTNVRRITRKLDRGQNG